MNFFILKASLFEPSLLLKFINSDFRQEVLNDSVLLGPQGNEINSTLKEAESYQLIPEGTSVHIALNLTF